MLLEISYNLNIKLIGISQPVEHLAFIFAVSPFTSTEHDITPWDLLCILYHLPKILLIYNLHRKNFFVRTEYASIICYIEYILCNRCTGAKRRAILANCLPLAPAKYIPFRLHLLMTSIMRGSILSVPSGTSVPSISDAISFIIVYLSYVCPAAGILLTGYCSTSTC